VLALLLVVTLVVQFFIEAIATAGVGERGLDLTPGNRTESNSTSRESALSILDFWGGAAGGAPLYPLVHRR
jgi:hypothetical protein